jgi:tartrate dehydratase alpha subunit/fumarate hydratase class I-like protein
MAAIEEIAIEVPSAVASAYRRATDSERQQIANQIGLMLRASTVSRQEAIDHLQQMD